MPGLLSKLLHGKDGNSKKHGGKETNVVIEPPKPRWEGDVLQRKLVEPEELHELIRGCTVEIKSRGKDWRSRKTRQHVDR